MYAINMIQQGDFILLKSKEELEKQFGTSANRFGCIDGLRFGENVDDCLIIDEFEITNLGKVIRVSEIIPSERRGSFYVKIQANGVFDKMELKFQSNVIQSELIKSVYLNGKWIDSYEIIDFIFNK